MQAHGYLHKYVMNMLESVVFENLIQEKNTVYSQCKSHKRVYCKIGAKMSSDIERLNSISIIVYWSDKTCSFLLRFLVLPVLAKIAKTEN